MKRSASTDYRTDRVKKPERNKMVRLRDQGKSYQDIALELDRSVRTVKKHLEIAAREKAQSSTPDSVQLVLQRALQRHFSDLLRVAETLRESCAAYSPKWFLREVENYTRRVSQPSFNVRGGHDSLYAKCYEKGRFHGGADYLRALTNLLIQEETASKGLLYECLWEHLSAHQISRDYGEWKRMTAQMRHNCCQLLIGICQSAEEAIQEVFEVFGIDYQPKFPPEVANIAHDWGKFVETLKGLGDRGNLDAFMRSACEPLAVEGNTLVLGFYYTFHKERIEEPAYRVLVEKKLAEYFHTPYKLHCVLYPSQLKVVVWRKNIDEVFATSVYQYATGRKVIEKDADESEAKYQIEQRTASEVATLFLGDAKLACLPLPVLKSVKAAHESLRQRFTSSAEAKEVTDLAGRSSEITHKLQEQFDILLAQRVLPGKCRACPSI